MTMAAYYKNEHLPSKVYSFPEEVRRGHAPTTFSALYFYILVINNDDTQSHDYDKD